MKTLLAAALLVLPQALLGQPGVSPNSPGAVGIAQPNVPTPTPTRAAGAAAFSAAAGQVKPHSHAGTQPRPASPAVGP
jgi:hypothetical protein